MLPFRIAAAAYYQLMDHKQMLKAYGSEISKNIQRLINTKDNFNYINCKTTCLHVVK